MDEEDYHIRQMLNHLEIADRVPGFEKAELHKSEDFGIDDGTLSLLTDRIRTEHSYCQGKTVKAMNKLIDDTLNG